MLFWIRTYLFLAPIDYFSLFSFWPNFFNKSGHISAQLSRNLIADISCSLPWKADFALLVNALVAIGMIFMLFVWFDGFGGFSACCVLGSLPFRIDRVCSWCIFYLNVSSSTWKFYLEVLPGSSLSEQACLWVSKASVGAFLKDSISRATSIMTFFFHLHLSFLCLYFLLRDLLDGCLRGPAFSARTRLVSLPQPARRITCGRLEYPFQLEFNLPTF